MIGEELDRREQPERLLTETIRADRKRIHFDLLRNRKGIFLKLTEEYGQTKNRILIPIEILSETAEALQRMATAAVNKQ